MEDARYSVATTPLRGSGCPGPWRFRSARGGGIFVQPAAAPVAVFTKWCIPRRGRSDRQPLSGASPLVDARTDHGRSIRQRLQRDQHVAADMRPTVPAYVPWGDFGAKSPGFPRACLQQCGRGYES